MKMSKFPKKVFAAFIVIVLAVGLGAWYFSPKDGLTFEAFKLQKSVTIPAGGRMKAIGVEVYWDANLTQAVTYVDWGLLEPGQVKPITVYVLSTGRSNIDVTLSMTTANWTPIEAASFISLSWDRKGYILAPDQSVEAVLTLTVSSAIQDIDTFNFEIIITGSG